ncbi:unnamed protein product [marine sediment metagenome]|uniref:Uncharacterized protein n=1 Tax=marine sediment metagenome TaxID=412755 RepID=X1V510_9ZZZZ
MAVLARTTKATRAAAQMRSVLLSGEELRGIVLPAHGLTWDISQRETASMMAK